MTNTLIGYVRCSTDDQSPAAQFGTLGNLGVAPNHLRGSWPDWPAVPRHQIVVEEAIGLSSYGKIQAILTGMELPDEVEDEKNDGEFEAAWTPSFQS